MKYDFLMHYAINFYIYAFFIRFGLIAWRDHEKQCDNVFPAAFDTANLAESF